MCGIAASSIHRAQAGRSGPRAGDDGCSCPSRPDCAGVWNAQPVGLGHRRLSIIDLAVGRSR